MDCCAGELTSLTELHGLARRLPKLKLERQRLQVVAGLFVPDLRDDLGNGPEVLRNDNRKQKQKDGGRKATPHAPVAQPRHVKRST